MEKKESGKKNSKVRAFILLQIGLLIFSLGGICSKMAGKQEFLSFGFILFMGLLVAVLGTYALIWQQVLKELPLIVAYGCKGIIVFYGLLWGALFFGEQIKPNMIIGAVIVLIGIIFFVKGDAEEESREEESHE